MFPCSRDTDILGDHIGHILLPLRLSTVLDTDSSHSATSAFTLRTLATEEASDWHLGKPMPYRL